MPPDIHRDQLVTSWYGQDIYVEAWQPEGGEAFVHLIEVGQLPPIESPDLPNYPNLQEALQGGLRFATQLADN